ncbi:hypothetical protein BSPWISOX_366 [uncultured Gammaproteobacteria bacterium]|nr:hypothetical protein BSPWISOX_366 [uncultured Gammaproteobacteria bacterium]
MDKITSKSNFYFCNQIVACLACCIAPACLKENSVSIPLSLY